MQRAPRNVFTDEERHLMADPAVWEKYRRWDTWGPEMPLADERWQPSQFALAHAQFADVVVLRRQIRKIDAREVRKTAVWGLIAIELSLATAALRIIVDMQRGIFPYIMGTYSLGNIFLLLYALAALASIISVRFAYRRMLKPRYCTITADATGLTMDNPSQADRSKRHVSLAWSDIRGWVVEPPFSPNGWSYPMYDMYAAEGPPVIVWDEPEDAELAEDDMVGDPCAAFRARADLLRAVIAARTGLPLRTLVGDGKLSTFR